MNNWVAALCIALPLLSLALIWRRQSPLPISRRIAASLLQLAIWVLVWALWQPPALLPMPQRATLEADLNALAATPGAEARSLLPREVARLERLAPDTAFERDALRDLPPVRLDFSDSSAVPRVSARWSRELHLGESLQVTVHGIEPGARVTLEDPFGSRVDAVSSADGGSVRLRDTPRLAGRQLYRLHIEGGAGETRQPLPVTVHDAERPAVLLWLARADFESAALSRWLRQSGVRSQVITRLAPDIERRQAFNGLEDAPENPLAPATPFDLLILDSHLWPQLDAAQRDRLEAIAAERSLLWLVGADSPAGFLAYARDRGTALQAVPPAETDSPLQAPAQEIPPLLLAGYQPGQPRAADVTLESGTGTAYWARSDGSQSLGFVLFDRSHRWITAGYGAEFARLWKTLFDRQLAHRGGRAPLSMQTPLPRAGHRLTLCAPGLDGPPQLVPLDNRRDSGSPLTGVPGSNGGNCFSYWPQQSGWYGVAEDGKTEGGRPLYVFAAEDWPQWQRSLAGAESLQMGTARLGPAPAEGAARTPLPRPWIALVLLLLLASTWLLERRTLKS